MSATKLMSPIDEPPVDVPVTADDIVVPSAKTMLPPEPDLILIEPLTSSLAVAVVVPIPRLPERLPKASVRRIGTVWVPPAILETYRPRRSPTARVAPFKAEVVSEYVKSPATMLFP